MRKKFADKSENKINVTLKAQSMCQANTAIVSHLAHHNYYLSIMFLLENGLWLTFLIDLQTSHTVIHS